MIFSFFIYLFCIYFMTFLFYFHKWCMILSWGVCFPLSICIMKYLKIIQPFEIHRCIQYIGFILNTMGFISIVVATQVENNSHFKTSHQILGLILYILLFIQIICAYIRPKPSFSFIRFIWEWFHWAFGYALLLIGYINMYLQIKWSLLYNGMVISFLSIFISHYIAYRINLLYERDYILIDSFIHSTNSMYQ